MSEFYPENELNHHVPASPLGQALSNLMRHDSLQVSLEKIPKAVVGGWIAYPQPDGTNNEYLVIVSRYDAPLSVPSTDGCFYDVQVMLKSTEHHYKERYALSDVSAYSVDKDWNLTLSDESLEHPLPKNEHEYLGSLLSYTIFDDASTQEAMGYLEKQGIIEPRSELDQQYPDMPLYDIMGVLRREMHGDTA